MMDTMVRFGNLFFVGSAEFALSGAYGAVDGGDKAGESTVWDEDG